MGKYNLVRLKLEEQLILISKENISLFKKAKHSIPMCIKALDELKGIINKYGFRSKQEEVLFFKEFKPSITSKLIYYIQIFNIESKKPIGIEKQLRKYFTNFLKTINKFKSDNIMFYNYYQSDSIHLDEKFFTRNDYNLHLIPDLNSLNYDFTFNTSHDEKIAQIIANEMLTDYLQNQLNKLDKNLFSGNAQNTIKEPSPLKWTDSKVALIELIYALYSCGSFNKGTLELKELVTILSEMFSIELGDFYRTWAEMKLRKEPTKYLDTLKVCLENKINIDLQ